MNAYEAAGALNMHIIKRSMPDRHETNGKTSHKNAGEDEQVWRVGSGRPGIVMTPPTRHTRFVVTAFRMDIKKAPSLTAFYKRMSINIITGY